MADPSAIDELSFSIFEVSLFMFCEYSLSIAFIFSISCFFIVCSSCVKFKIEIKLAAFFLAFQFCILSALHQEDFFFHLLFEVDLCAQQM